MSKKKLRNQELLDHRQSKNFKHGGKWYMLYCPCCELENYMPAVASGKCAWCGFDMNLDKEKTENEEGNKKDESRKEQEVKEETREANSPTPKQERK